MKKMVLLVVIFALSAFAFADYVTLDVIRESLSDNHIIHERPYIDGKKIYWDLSFKMHDEKDEAFRAAFIEIVMESFARFCDYMSCESGDDLYLKGMKADDRSVVFHRLMMNIRELGSVESMDMHLKIAKDMSRVRCCKEDKWNETSRSYNIRINKFRSNILWGLRDHQKEIKKRIGEEKFMEFFEKFGKAANLNEKERSSMLRIIMKVEKKPSNETKFFDPSKSFPGVKKIR